MKKSGRDGTICVIICVCMETTQGVSLYSYLYLRLADTKIVVFLFFYIFSSTKLKNKRVEQVLLGSRGQEGEEGK
jgi:hypothetical protein